MVSSSAAESAGTVEARYTAGVDNWSEVVHNLIAVATAGTMASGIADIVAQAMVVVIAYYSPIYISK